MVSGPENQLDEIAQCVDEYLNELGDQTLQPAQSFSSPSQAMVAAEAKFIQLGKLYAERESISYEAFKMCGVPERVLIAAGIPKNEILNPNELNIFEDAGIENFDDLEKVFIDNGKEYAEKHGLTYQDLAQIGVDPDVLKDAGIEE